MKLKALISDMHVRILIGAAVLDGGFLPKFQLEEIDGAKTHVIPFDFPDASRQKTRADALELAKRSALKRLGECYPTGTLYSIDDL